MGKLLGHSDYKSTLVYAHLSDAAARAGADKVAYVLERSDVDGRTNLTGPYRAPPFIAMPCR